MARILEALKQAEAGRRSPVALASEPTISSTPAMVTPIVTATEEVPFVEVGGARMEGSPVVLGSGLAGKISHLPSPPLAKGGNGGGQVTPVARPADSQAVTFRPVSSANPLQSPRERLAPELIAFHRPDHPVSEQYRSLLATLLAQATTEEAATATRVLLLSGATSEAGTTTVLLNLAFTHARQGRQRVVVVDAGGVRSAVAQRLGLPPAPGLREVLTGALPLYRALRESGQPNLQVLTAGEVPGRSCLAVKSFGATLGQLRHRCDLVLVDAPSWNGSGVDYAEMAALTATGDALFLVVPHHHFESTEVMDLIQAIARQGIRLRGCVLTQR